MKCFWSSFLQHLKNLFVAKASKTGQALYFGNYDNIISRRSHAILICFLHGNKNYRLLWTVLISGDLLRKKSNDYRAQTPISSKFIQYRFNKSILLLIRYLCVCVCAHARTRVRVCRVLRGSSPFLVKLCQLCQWFNAKIQGCGVLRYQRVMENQRQRVSALGTCGDTFVGAFRPCGNRIKSKVGTCTACTLIPVLFLQFLDILHCANAKTWLHL